MANATFVARSKNDKVGTASVTYASQASCPKSCPLFNNGCYAELGNAGFTTGRLNRDDDQDPVSIAKNEAAFIDASTIGLPLRVHAVGDCATDETAQIVSGAMERFEQRFPNSFAWTYTHAWKPEYENVKRESWGTANVLASCETTDQVKQATELGWATAIVVSEFESDSWYMKDGVRIQPCLEQTKGIKCVDCRMCSNSEMLREKQITIGFAAHGVRKAKVKEMLNGESKEMSRVEG